jgi:hypothetical protein
MMAIFCKSCKKDIYICDRMLKSFILHNRDGIKMFVSVPESEIKYFLEFSRFDNVEVLSDQSYADKYMSQNQYHGLSVGYVNQEICKLSFWETKFALNYLCVDSDVIFLRDFFITDFLANQDIPYTVLVQDKELSIEKEYRDFWIYREKFIRTIYREIDLVDKRYRTCHGMQVLNAKVLNSLKEDFMLCKNYTYEKLISIAPYEFTWYNAWFQKCGLVEEKQVEPFFYTFHYKNQLEFYKQKLLTEDDIAKAYIGVVYNSNMYVF